MELADWDALEARLAERVFADGALTRHAIAEVCADHPRAAVADLILAVSSMAVALEDEWLTGPLEQQKRLVEAYRALAALSADCAGLATLGRPVETCGALYAHWVASRDRYFLRPA